MDEEKGKRQLRDCLVSALCFQRTLDYTRMAQENTRDGTAPATPASPFATTLFPSLPSLQTEYSQSTPYHHAVIHQLFDSDFLAKARDEIVDNVSFSHKETDICA